MIAPNPDLLCNEAGQYYYDFLSEGDESIPDAITEHMEQCEHCQRQLAQLRRALSQIDDLELQQSEVGPAPVIGMLKRHFAYIGKCVTCSTVRPFILSLLDPVLTVRIPTPITAHLCNCRQCSEDLDKIRNLNLSNKQLLRLSQLFSEEPSDGLSVRPEIEMAAKSVVAMEFKDVNADVLKQLCKDPACRKLLYKERQSICDSLRDNPRPAEFPCESVSSRDIFDYVVPYGLDPAHDQYAKFRESLTLHLRSCPVCLARMQELYREIYSIVERPESEVITVYNVDEFSERPAMDKSDGFYRGFPISVEVVGREDEMKEEQEASVIGFGDALKKQKISGKKLRPLFKTAIAAAAVVLIGFGLLLSIPTAKAVTIEGIYKAIERVRNVHISSFVTDREEPIQEMWLSRTANIYMSKTGSELVLWDVANGTKKTKLVDAGVINTTKMTKDSIAGIKTRIKGSLGLIPFYNISEVPAGSKWSQVDSSGLEVGEGIEVYDLKWTQKASDGSDVFKKWRVFVEAETNRLHRTEFYEKLTGDEEYALLSVKEIEYLEDSQIRDLLREASF